MTLPRMNRAQRRLFEEICDFCREHNQQHAIRSKTVSKATTQTRFQHLVRALVVDLHHLNHRKEQLMRLKPRNIIALIQYWEGRLTAQTIRNRLSTLRWLCKKLNKNDIVPEDPRVHMTDPSNYELRPYPKTDTTPSAVGVDVADFLKRVAEHDLLVALVQLLKIEWGLRRREAIMTRPHEQDKGDYFLVAPRRGPKGGRPRTITHYNFRAEMSEKTGEIQLVDPTIDPVKREILDLLKCFTNRRGSLIPEGYSLSRWMRWERTVVSDYCGLSLRKLGITSHKFRHEYANRRGEIVSGLARGFLRVEALSPEEIRRDHLARRLTTADLGHHAKATMNFYAGQTADRSPVGFNRAVADALKGRLVTPILRRDATGKLIGGSGLRVSVRYTEEAAPNEANDAEGAGESTA